MITDEKVVCEQMKVSGRCGYSNPMLKKNGIAGVYSDSLGCPLIGY